MGYLFLEKSLYSSENPKLQFFNFTKRNIPPWLHFHVF